MKGGSRRQALTRRPRCRPALALPTISGICHPTLALPTIIGICHPALALPGIIGAHAPEATQRWHCQRLLARTPPMPPPAAHRSGQIHDRGRIWIVLGMTFARHFPTSHVRSSASSEGAGSSKSKYFGLPGRLLNLGITFRCGELSSSLVYVNYHYLADTWIATFSRHVIRDLCDADEDFRCAVYRNTTALMRDLCRTAALFRSNYLHFGVRHLAQMLVGAGVFRRRHIRGLRTSIRLLDDVLCGPLLSKFTQCIE